MISETAARMTLYGGHKMSAGGVVNRASQAGVGEGDCRLSYWMPLATSLVSTSLFPTNGSSIFFEGLPLFHN